MAEATFTRTDSHFTSQGVECAAWLYLPSGIAKPPVVVMAHGFGGERSFRLPAYAERFVREGMACLLFDYRSFGASQGEPRNFINPTRHVEDWQAAVAHARSLSSVDRDRVALWSTSFGGGHVIVTAARDHGIRAIVAQIPFLDGRASQRSLAYRFQAVYHGLLDLIGAALLGRRHYVPIVGAPETFAMLNTPGSLEGAKKLLPPDVAPGRTCPAEIALSGYFYRPILHASSVTCPALIVYAEHDNLVPVTLVERACARFPDVRCVGLPVGHFDVYVGETFDEVVRLETDFLREKLAFAGECR